jgi:zinc/manganese transport system ATP-binding protein
MSISFDNVTLGYDLHPAVHHLSLEIELGSMVALVGPNGAGKSTLLKGIMGQLQLLGGSISLGGLGHAQIAYLPQLSQVDRSFPITVHQLVSLGAWGETGAFKSVGEKQQAAVHQALHQLGLEGFEHRMIDTLSGGQMQRVLFARLLLQKAELILLDEPFTGVDARTCGDLIAQIKRWKDDGKTIIAVLHDLHQVKEHFPTTLLLSRRAIAYGNTLGVLTEENLQKASQFNEAFDDHAEPCLMVGEH